MQMSGQPPQPGGDPCVWGPPQGHRWNTGIQAVPSQPEEDLGIIWGF